MFRILDKYIFLQLVGPFLFGFFLFVTIIAIDPLMSALHSIVNENVSFWVMFRWFLNRLPQDMVFTFPMSVLLSTLLVFGRMSKDSETTALRAGGINFYRILLPVLVFALIITAISFFFNEFVVPTSNQNARNIKRYEIMKLVEPEASENSIMRVSDGAFAYARKVYEKSGKMEKVLLEYYDESGNLDRRVSATTAEWNGKNWTFKQVVEQNYQNENALASPTSRPELVIAGIIEKPEDFARQSKKPNEMSYTELKDRIDTYERTKFMDTTALRVELAMKTSLPFASFFFAIIGASFGLTNSRSGAFIGFGVSMLIIFLYYVLMSLFTALGKSGYLPPMLAAWVQNIIFAFAGFHIVSKINQ
ncbi:MAG: lipopolysaccharide export system permease protein [Clostridiales bacterium]|jgi:lipopolysaccharide export system permease protein|nr:lipopolysaccharide export system permease protein [Clostridiales bacterium]MDN5283383.1 lipopolysaccharide export system permease protein [Candidatus Ozemobacter sp.]